MKPQFLNWNKPLLHLAAEYFVKMFGKDGRLDMKNIVVALPTSPAKERLEELLAIEAEKMPRHDWYPPRFITFGHLPEEFYTQEKIVADEMTQSFTWINVLENAEEHLRGFLPVLPEKDDVEARFRLGMMFAKLHYDLASEGKDCSDVADLCAKNPKIPTEFRRWQALAELEKRYLDELDKKGFWDIQSARQNAVEPRVELCEKVLEERQKYIEQFRKDRKQIYLAGVTDMNKAQKEILNIFGEFVHPLVFAPEELKDRFDNFGCLRPEKWVDADIHIDDSQIAVVLDDHEQADTVMRTIAELQGNAACGDVIVGVPNTDLIPLLEDRFERADIETKYVKRKKIQKTGVYRLLEILHELLEKPKDGLPYRKFAELLRHPEIYFRVTVENSAGELLELLDKYHGKHLPETVSKDWLKDMLDKDDAERQEKDTKNAEYLTRVFENVQKLLTLDKNDNEDNRIRLNSVLKKLYENDKEQSQDLKKTLEIIREAADKVDNVCAKTPLGKVPFANYLRLVLLQLSGAFIPPYETRDAVDFVGWLDIPMSDVKIIIITGMNDGTVPSYVVSDQFLPDHLRTELKIENNEQRIARDAYNLSVILRTRPVKNVKLTAGRAAAPSRLFFADKDKKVCERVREFFKDKKDVKRQPEVYFANEGKMEKRTNSVFEIPKPEPIIKPKTSMSVTEFKKYKQCPYRFYLGNILYLKHLDDSDNELAANSFGDLIHKALEDFGKDKTKRDSNDPQTIFQAVEKKFDELVAGQFGNNAKAAVLFQIELAKKRLEHFAKVQAARRNEGWQIIETEKSFRTENEISICDGMILTGKIDRIDKKINKDGTAEYAVLDYKSSDTAKTPDDVHRQGKKGEKKWIDFQLPLYHYLLTETGEYEGNISLGYFTLPKDNKGGVKLADEWSEGEIRDAVLECQDIANAILKKKFEISKEPPLYDDFPEICLTPQVKRKW